MMTQAERLQEEMTIEEYMDLEEQIDNMSVYMYGVVEDLLNKCSEIKNISPELVDIIRQI